MKTASLRMPRMSFLTRLHYALSDLRRRLGTTALNVAAVSVAVVYLMLFGFYGWVIYHYQQTVVEGSLPRLIVARCADVNDPLARFTARTLNRISRFDEVELAFPKVELGVKLNCQGGTELAATAEGTVPGDPALSPNRLVWGSACDGGAARQAVLSQGLFARLGGRCIARGPEPRHLNLQVSRTVSGAVQSQILSLRVVGLLHDQAAEKIYLPLALVEALDQWCSHKIDGLSDADGRLTVPEPRYASCLAWSPQDQTTQARTAEAQGLRIRIEREMESNVLDVQGDVWAQVHVSADALSAPQRNALVRLPAGCEVRLARLQPLKRQGKTIRLVALSDADARWSFTPDGKCPPLGRAVAARGGGGLAVPGTAGRIRVAGGAPALPGDGDYYCSLETWQQFAEGRRQALAPPREIFAVRIPDVQFQRERQRLAAVGIRLETVTAVREETFVRYRIQDADRQDGSLDAKLITVVGMSRPVFRDAVPHHAEQATIGGAAVTVEGSSAADLRRFEQPMLCGRWLAQRVEADEIVLPAWLARRAFPRRALHDCLGQVLHVRFHRRQRVSAGPSLVLPLLVAGVVEGDTTFATFDFLRNVALWRQNNVVYNSTKNEFELPRDIYRRSGHVRCNIYARDQESVGPLVARLEAAGYRTENSLGEQAGLRKLAAALLLLIASFVLGCVGNAVITVAIATMMNVRAKLWEIGILRAHGAGAGDLLGILSIQGALIGSAAFVVGCAVVITGEPALRRLLDQAFRLPLTASGPSICSPSLAWLFALVFVVSASSSMIGVLVPAIRACRIAPVEALTRRE